MPRKNANLGEQLTPPTTPGSTASVSSASSTGRRLPSGKQLISHPKRARDDPDRDTDAIIAQQTVPQIHRPSPCPLPNAGLSRAAARGDYMDLTQDSPDKAVFGTPPLRKHTKNVREDRPTLVQSESAPVAGNPSHVEPNVEAMRSKSDPAGNSITEGERRAMAQREKIDSMTAQCIDMDMRMKIKEDISDVSDLYSMGWTYVMQVKIHGQKVVKIGFTKDGARNRANSIISKCGRTIKIESVDDSGEIRFCKRAEALAKMELKMARYEFTCTCSKKTQHTEYFKVDYDIAVRVVRRWSTFCSLSPYNSAGQLSRIWCNRLQRKDKLRPEEVENRDIGPLLDTWDRFVYVSWTREVLDDLQVAMENFHDYGSPVVCMLFTLTLLQLWPDSMIMLWVHAFCILWFSARTMTDGSSLSGRIFRKVFDISMPWQERRLLKGVESRILPERNRQDHFGHDGEMREIERLAPPSLPVAY